MSQVPRYDPSKDPLFLAYFDLWCRYRALIAVVGRISGVPAERFEDDVERWVADHYRELVRECLERFRTYVVRPGVEGPTDDPPPQAP
jgi:hypothetical protein